MVFSSKLKKKLHLTNFFIAVIALGIIARLISLFLVPESAYADSLFHLNLIKQAVETGFISTPDVLTTPLYYSLNAFLFSFSGLSISMPFIKIIPFCLILLQLAFVYLISKILFKENVLLPLALTAISSWLIRYSPVNNTDLFASLIVLVVFYFLLKLKHEKSVLNLIIIVLLLPCLAYSKANALLLLPFFLIAFAFIAFKAFGFVKTCVALLASSLLSIFWFFVPFAATGFVSPEAITKINSSIFAILNPSNLFLSFLSYWDFPPLSAFKSIGFFQNIPWLPSAIIFSLIVLPLTICLIYGLIKAIKSKKIEWLLLSVLFIVLILFALKNSVDGLMYVRYAMPAIAISCFFICLTFNSLNKSIFKKIIVVSIALFAIYSLLMTSLSAYYYFQIEEKNKALYLELNSLSLNDKVASINKFRQAGFFSNANVVQPVLSNKNDFALAYSELKQQGFTHLAVFCYKDAWNKKVLRDLTSQNKLNLVFEKECTQLYKIN